jgi:hypothetical protein
LVDCFTLRARLGHVVIGLAKRAAGATACQPRINAASMESVAAGQPSYIVIVFEGIQANRAGVTGLGHHLRCSGSADWVVLVVRLVVITAASMC